MTKMNWEKANQQQKVGESKEPTILGKLKMATDKQKEYLVALGYVGPIDDLTTNQASILIKSLNAKSPKATGHYPGKGKVSVLLVGGPKDGERIWLAKGRTFVTLNQSTRDSFNSDSEIPYIVKCDYEKGEDGNFYFVE